MAGPIVNQASQFSADIVNYIQEEVMRLSQRYLVVYQHGDKLRLPRGRGTTYTGSRYDRLPLPFQSLAEGVPPLGETVPLVQVQATAVQWGDSVTVTDVTEATIYHSVYQQAIKLTAIQLAETLERITFNNLLGFTQINYVNSVGSRANLGAGDVLNPQECNRAFAQLFNLGAPMFMGPKEEDIKQDFGSPEAASRSPASMAHYVAVIGPAVEQDMRQNPQVQQAWSYSDVNKLYNNELGVYSGIRWVRSNLMPSWTAPSTGNPTLTGNNTGGSLAAATYTVQITGSNALTAYEDTIYATQNVVVGGSGNGSITFTTPNVSGEVYNAYIKSGASTSPVNLALSASGPASGSMAGQAIQLPANTTVTLTGIGASQTPPAIPASGVTVYPTFVFGENSYGIVMLEDPEFFFLKDADKVDPLNQLRVVSWKVFFGVLLENNTFALRIESTSGTQLAFG